MARGNAKAAIYLDNRDNERFLEILSDVHDRFGVVCHTYCLVKNHYHLVVETPNGNVSEAIRHLNGVYAQWWNQTHHRCGHLFQGRFKAQLVQQDAYLRSVCRYVVLNPPRAGLVCHPADWPWSSYRAAAGIEVSPPFLTTTLLYRLVTSADDPTPEKAYERFVLQPGDELDIGHAIRRDSRFIGEESYWSSVRAVCAPEQAREVPRRDYLRPAPPLARLLPPGAPLASRNQAIREAFADSGYSTVAIARHLGMHPETIRRVLRDRRSAAAKPNGAPESDAPPPRQPVGPLEATGDSHRPWRQKSDALPG